ncbi:MAG TPA: DPP IV N-terminal domain-containing protein, partial [Longimicrobiales bacterium]|nr:DPP IV N-terminal domain-containing protein [Longimicrobiales bacterium]
EFVDGEGSIRFQTAEYARWECDIQAYACMGPDSVAARPDWQVPSPDGRWVAYEHEENLWVREVATGDSTQLSTDGIEDYGYAVVPEGCCQEITNRRAGERLPPVLHWSPDSRRIATHRYDEREVEQFHLLEAADGRPILHSWAYALPGDSVIPTVELWFFDVDVGAVESGAAGSSAGVQAAVEPQPGYFTTGDTIWRDVQWADDGQTAFYTHRSRDFKTVQLFRVDPTSGAATRVLEETGPTYVELNQMSGFNPNWRVLGDGSEVLWWSERDGWGHLYLYDGQGTLQNQVTSGAWLVLDVLHVDEANRQVYFTGLGREDGRHPYFPHLYRVGLDGSGLTLLSSEDASHRVTASPSGRWFVDTYSTPTEAPTTVVRTRDGRASRTIEEADISRLVETGWTPPTAFTAKGRDGRTDVHGLLWFPSDFDPEGTYPVIDYIYPGPQIGSVTNYDFTPAGGLGARALAELGFIVFAVDAFGTPNRSKAFHDGYYGDMGDNGLPDHIAAMKELAVRHPQMDLGRVGIYGHSGGGFSSTDAILRHPDFFKVAVSGAGNHDNRGYHFPWAEKYQGLLVENEDGTDSYDSQANQNLAENLEGKLLLHYGTLDDNVHPNMTIRLIEELTKANRDYDLFIVPNANHGYALDPYVVRRTWDYFVEHLLGVEPPAEYLIQPPGG